MNHHPISSSLKQINEFSIHLWIIALDDTIRGLEEYQTFLSDEELERARQFGFPELGRRYIVAHARLREILARYIDLQPDRITFLTNTHGKPFINIPDGNIDIQFNLSHSHELAVVAITRGRRIGVDVERLKPLGYHMKIAERYFSPAEIASLKRQKSEQIDRAFIQLWAGKEALIKAQGNGMSLPLNQISLEALIEQPEKTGVQVKQPDQVATWSVNKFKLPAGYAGAVAFEGTIRKIAYRR
jgi:4'-phosphopantetheinyl transferase